MGNERRRRTGIRRWNSRIGCTNPVLQRIVGAYLELARRLAKLLPLQLISARWLFTNFWAVDPHRRADYEIAPNPTTGLSLPKSKRHGNQLRRFTVRAPANAQRFHSYGSLLPRSGVVCFLHDGR